MNKISNRAVSVLLIALLIIAGLAVYILRYIDHGRDWAAAFSTANSLSSGSLTDRDGRLLASYDSAGVHYSDDPETRLACYHITGDFWNRTGTGALSAFWNSLQGFSLLTGSTRSRAADLSLTVDSELCRLAYRGLNGRKGAVLLSNYKTGEILVLVSTPAVDPADADAVPQEGAYINRCLSATFTPGSVFKLLTAAAAIESVPNMDSRSFDCEGKFTIAGVDIKCTGTHYTQSFEDALANSCNSAFAQIAVKVGQTSMVEHARNYGFLDGHSLDGIPTAAGQYPTAFVGDPELAWSGIGQSTDLVNPYQMLRFVSAIANNGFLVEPHLLETKVDGSGTQLMNASTAQRVGRMMSYNVVSHYGRESFPALNIAAKTGTAELGDGTTHAWFVGFLADESHPYAFVVLLERGGGGLVNAGPIANTVLQAAVRE